MSEEKKKKLPPTAWPEGHCPNKFGRGGNPDKPKTRGKPVSSLRKTLKKLLSLEPKALDNIEKAVNGEEVDKVALDTSKWTISTIVTVQKAAVQEENVVHSIKQDLEGDEVEEKEEEPQVRFSLNMLPQPKDLQ